MLSQLSPSRVLRDGDSECGYPPYPQRVRRGGVGQRASRGCSSQVAGVPQRIVQGDPGSGGSCFDGDVVGGRQEGTGPRSRPGQSRFLRAGTRTGGSRATLFADFSGPPEALSEEKRQAKVGGVQLRPWGPVLMVIISRILTVPPLPCTFSF